MHYRSIADMNATIVAGLHGLPRDLDLVVGVPRSGLLAANILSLTMNIPMTDLDGFIAGRVLSSGVTKRRPARSRNAADMRKVLVIDDSVNTGAALRDARSRIATAGATAELTFAAVYGSTRDQEDADYLFEIVPQPRMFQWNFMHHVFLEQSCVDIDGVLCEDPTAEQNDDGPAYRQYLKEARPLHRSSRKIAYLVTSRLERYRSQTQAWLARNEIRYGRLIMLDLPSKDERQQRSAHGRFKADFYGASDAILFIESEAYQASEIARLSGKPVLCTETQQIVRATSPAAQIAKKLTALGSPWSSMREYAVARLSPRPYADGQSADDEPDISYVLEDPKDQARPRTLISYLGRTTENTAKVIESVRKICRSRSEFPVVVLSEFRQDLMTACEAPVEFVPEMQHVPVLTADEYRRYVSQRWALMLEKWKIEREVTLASSLDEFLSAQTQAR